MSDNGGMAQARVLYEDGRPYTVPDSLEELIRPTSGVVELPLPLDWSEQGQYDLQPCAALRKLTILDAAESLEDLRVPPGNRLEKLKRDRAGQHSIRINDQWRICFRWIDAGPEDVEITDYH